MAMNEQDKRAVETMCRSGLDLKELFGTFPAFSKEEIEKVYNRIKEEELEETARETDSGMVLEADQIADIILYMISPTCLYNLMEKRDNENRCG